MRRGLDGVCEWAVCFRTEMNVVDWCDVRHKPAFELKRTFELFERAENSLYAGLSHCIVS